MGILFLFEIIFIFKLYFVFKGGAVADPRAQDQSTNLIRQLNDYVGKDNRVEISMLNIGDGTTFCFKK